MRKAKKKKIEQGKKDGESQKREIEVTKKEVWKELRKKPRQGWRKKDEKAKRNGWRKPKKRNEE